MNLSVYVESAAENCQNKTLSKLHSDAAEGLKIGFERKTKEVMEELEASFEIRKLEQAAKTLPSRNQDVPK